MLKGDTSTGAEIVGGSIVAVNELAPEEARHGLSVSPAFIAARAG